MDIELPLVSVIIPTRNEEGYIRQCLNSILDNDYPKERLEVIVVDGVSEDRTQEIIAEYSGKYPFVKLIDNPERVTPVAFNRGIQYSKGDIVTIMSAHAYYEKDHISKCVEHLKENSIAGIGGVCITLPGKDSLIARAIAFVLSSPFGVGNAYFRIGTGQPRYVDTVVFGFYKRKTFEDVGVFDEKLIRNQDIEFNSRIGKNGGKLLLVPEIRSYYYARATLKQLWIQNWKNGVWNIYLTRIIPGSLSIRHFIPMLFISGLLGSLFLSIFSNPGLILLILICSSYLFASLLFSVKIGLREGIKYIALLPVVFFSLHSSYGLGMLWGIFTSWRFTGKRRDSKSL